MCDKLYLFYYLRKLLYIIFMHTVNRLCKVLVTIAKVNLTWNIFMFKIKTGKFAFLYDRFWVHFIIETGKFNGCVKFQNNDTSLLTKIILSWIGVLEISFYL